MSLSGGCTESVMMPGMVIDREEARLHTIAQVRAFLGGTTAIAFRVPKAERYRFIERVLTRLGYARHGGAATRTRGRGVTAAKHTTLVMGAVAGLSYEDKKGTRCERASRVRLSTLDDAGEVSIRHVLTHHIDAGSTLRTDGWRGYSDAALVRYTPRVRVVRTPERAHRVAPHIHRVVSNLKTGLNGTHHGVEPTYLQRYLDEFVFRVNRRHTPMAAFQTLLGLSTQKAPLPLPKLVNRSQP